MRRKERAITSQFDILNILGQATVCRIALHDDPYPYIVPLNFGIEERDPLTFYFHCAPEGRKLELIRKNNKVGFEVDIDTRVISGDEACDWTMHYRSVIGTGRITVVEDQEEKVHGLTLLMQQYSVAKTFSFNPKLLDRTVILKLEVKSISGKQHG